MSGVPSRGSRANTVQLVSFDEGRGWVLRLGPNGVLAAFDVPFGHLAYDPDHDPTLIWEEPVNRTHESVSRARVRLHAPPASSGPRHYTPR